jgi:hypothetical protein
MQGVGADGDGARGGDGTALQHHQGGGERDGQHHHRDARSGLSQGGRMQQALGGFIEQEDRRATHEHRLTQASQGFCLGMTEAMVAVRWAQGMTYRQPVEARCQAIQQGIHHAAHQGHRAAGEPGCELDER